MAAHTRLSGGGRVTAVRRNPSRARVLSHGSRGRVAIFARWFDTLWWVVSGACLLFGAASAMQRVMLLKAFREWWRRPVWLALRVTVLVAVLVSAGWLYLAGAGEHSRVMNISSATGDQNAYLLDAMQVYANRAGQDPSMLASGCACRSTRRTSHFSTRPACRG